MAARARRLRPSTCPWPQARRSRPSGACRAGRRRPARPGRSRRPPRSWPSARGPRTAGPRA
eukprot:8486742-Alexandrium_andersonii.AAC.1